MEIDLASKGLKSMFALQKLAQSLPLCVDLRHQVSKPCCVQPLH